MTVRDSLAPPLLPLVLWRTPPALAMVLQQEGVPFVALEHGPAALAHSGRFILFDGRREPAARVAAMLAADQTAFDVDRLRRGHATDPFAALLDTRPRLVRWHVRGYPLVERVNRHDRAAIRGRLLQALRDWLLAAGGIWARLGAYPHPYRSAFNLRIDLDEPAEDDYFRFARARRPIDDCTTHFVSTAAYGDLPRVLLDLRGLDAHSHGHHHVVYRDPAANRRNLERADRHLGRAGLTPRGFAAPEGRWNPGLNDAIESLCYGYSSEFQVGYDDRPFYPWVHGRWSRVLQVPVHPICEGLFLNAGASDVRVVGEHLASVVRSRIEAGEPAFVYGHPEGRLGRYPGIVEAIARAAGESSLVWRTTLGQFASWWRWRLERRWQLDIDGAGYRLRVENLDSAFTPVLEIDRGSHVASLPVRSPVMTIPAGELAYRGVARRIDRPHSTHVPPHPRHLARACLARLIDWETVTPLHELPESTPSQRWKKRLRTCRDRLRAHPQGGRR